MKKMWAREAKDRARIRMDCDTKRKCEREERG